MDEPDHAGQRMVRVLGHPLRVRILQILEGQDASPTRIAGITEETVGKVSYHIKVLLKENCVELHRTEPRRGTAEHFYRLKPQAPIGTSGDWREVPRSLQEHLVGAALDAFTTRAVSALTHGTFQEREGSILKWRPMKVDEEGWKEILEALRDTDERLHTISARNVERLRKKIGISVVVSFSAFEAPSPSGTVDGD